MHGSAISATRYVFQFDGKRYRAKACEDVLYGNLKGKFKQPQATPCEPGWEQNLP
jgi:hypothetical protein